MGIYPKSYFEANDIKTMPGKCFIIMPFGEEYDEIYHEILKECLEEYSFNCIRADELYGSKPIIEDILAQIESSDLVIADLTNKNPNVFYELGITHSRKDNDHVILISQKLDDVPFDLRPYRIIIYNTSISGIKSFRTQLQSALLEFRLRPLHWSGSNWIPISPIWYIEDNSSLATKIPGHKEIPLIFCAEKINQEELDISLSAISNGPEINIMFFSNGKERFSGYHLWFWHSGVKLRRLADEVKLNPEFKMAKNCPYQIRIKYKSGFIKVEIDHHAVLEYHDDDPLHHKRGLEYIGFNTSGSKEDCVIFQSFEII
ncbi:MAG: hypothetical protein R3F48_15590 [Candidatus Zixiibacteriota bacterium]